jgi:hypothetical protein
MRKIGLLVVGVIMLVLSSCKEEQTVKDCIISEIAKEKVQFEAAGIALQKIYAEQSADTIFIEIPSHTLTPYLKALGMIYDLPEIPYYDSIISIKNTINYTRKAIFEYENNQTWIGNWFEGQIPTGNSTIDSLIQQHELMVEPIDGMKRFKISSPRPLNYFRLIQVFETIPGIIRGYPVPSYSFDTKIEVTTTDDYYVTIKFFKGYEKCNFLENNCENYLYYEYLVNLTNCTAQFIDTNAD